MRKNSLSSAVGLALLGSSVVYFSHSQARDQVRNDQSDCLEDECEQSAAYSLKIISRGEGVPKASNDTPAGRQQNRRVDVSLGRQLRVANSDDKKQQLPADQSTGGAGGNYWISKNPTVLKQQLAINLPATATAENGSFESPVKISVLTNYSHFIDRWQLRIMPVGSSVDAAPLHILQGRLNGVATDIEWNEINGLSVGDKFDVALRVFDNNGNYDQTASRTIEIVAKKADTVAEKQSAQTDEVSLKSLDQRLAEYTRDFAYQSIAVSGSTVTVRGQSLTDARSVEVNGEKVSLSSDDRFAVEYILPPGDHEFDVVTKRKSGEETGTKLNVEVKPDYFFMVGLADLTAGENRVSGSLEPLMVDEDHYGGDIFVDGRLAFYLKGKVRGKYLLTAQMDTGSEDVSKLFDDFHRKDASSVFRRIDPDQYYLVYGDDSSLTDDTDSQGKLYLRVDWEKSHALWGNFNTAFSGTEFATFNRSLYGAQYRHRSMDATAKGDNKTEISAFMSKAQTVARHNEFTGTGGSLYYLRDQDIVLGSEKVWVEVRRSNSEQVLQKIPLEREKDYEIDEFQGRLILTRPLLSISAQAGPSIIRDEPQLGDNTYLIVDYEFVPANFDGGDAASGLRAKRWINDHIAVGGTWVNENGDADDYAVKGMDVTFKKSADTYLRLEMAQSQSSNSAGSFQSDDGGLSFTPFNTGDGDVSGTAVGVELRVSANDISEFDKPLTFAAWAKQRDSGFSTASLDRGLDTTDTGVEVVASLSDVLSLSSRASRLEKKTQSRESVLAVQADYQYTEKVTVSGEVRRVNDEALESGTSESATLAAGKVSVQVGDDVSAYAIAQTALDRSGNYNSNTLLTAGARARLSELTSINGEISSGDRGTNVSLGVERKLSDTYSVYANGNLLQPRDGSVEQMLTLGQRKALSDKLNVYTEHQFNSDDTKTGISNTIGLTNTFNRYTTGTLSFQSSRIEDEHSSVTELDTLSAGLSVKRQKSHLTSKLEFRQDKSDTVNTDQWVMTNNVEYRYSPSLRLQGRLNHSSTKDKIDADDARFTEAGIGFALRPVMHDRLNMLGRYTYLYDLPPLSQSDKTDRRLTVYSFENIYELGQRFSLGGKLAHRKGEIRTQRDGGGWIGNDATLAALRLRYKVPHGVDAMTSYHWLKSDAADGTRKGALLSLGYNVGSNLQFSVGYNFTAFDDDLANEF